MTATQIRNNNGQFLKGTHWRPHAVYREKAYLEREYSLFGRSAMAIAQEHGVTENGILYWLTKHKIECRSMSEIRASKHWGAAGAANPMFGKFGPANPNYISGSSPERQRAYGRGEGKAFLRAVMERDNFRCRRCDSPKKSFRGLHVHHIMPWASYPALRFEQTNCVTLCCFCHRWVHGKKNAERLFLPPAVSA